MLEIDWKRLEEIDGLFRRMVRKFVKERDKISVEGITLPGMLILRKIEQDGEQKLGDLAEQLDLTSGAITALCDKLEKKGFATRRRLAEDRRTVLLAITEEGRCMLHRNRDIGRKIVELLFASFTERELAMQKEMFTRITHQLDGFADTILATVRENARADGERREAEAPARPRTDESRFLSY